MMLLANQLSRGRITSYSFLNIPQSSIWPFAQEQTFTKSFLEKIDSVFGAKLFL